jgi:ribosome-associated protein
LSEETKQRLFKISGRRVTDDGVIIIIGRRYRSQDQNRVDAIERLIKLIQKALMQPKIRKATQPSFASKEARIIEKRAWQLKHSCRSALMILGNTRKIDANLTRYSI